MKSTYVGLVLTGVAASIALLIESRLQVTSDIHFCLQFVWVGVVGAALLAFSLNPALRTPDSSIPPMSDIDDASLTEEFHDEDRLWLQAHPDSSWNEQV